MSEAELPTREQIDAITDLDALTALRDDVFEDAKQIEAQLEYADGDRDWERRAIAALGYHRATIGNLDKAIHRLKTGAKKGPTPVEVQDAKARKAEAHAERLKAEAQAKAERAAAQREARRLETARALEAAKVSSAMQTAMRELLDNDAYSRVMARTWEIHGERLAFIVEKAA